MPGQPLSEDERNERVRIGATIRALREARGYKPDEFASLVGISRPYLSNIEAGRKGVTRILVVKFARVLDVKQVAIVRPGYFGESDQ